MSDIAIKLQNVSKFYKLYDQPKDRLKEALHPFKKKYHNPFYALKGLNLEIKKGDVLGVLGRNGCGKSTLLKLITGVLQPNEGSIEVDGKITALLELGAGFNPEFTGIDNIQFYAKVLGLSDKEFEEKLPLIIAFAELGEYLNQPVKTYSSGMKSRLGFAVAVHVDPEILILDEVLAVGDALFRRKCYAKMEEFFQAGKTLIYVSHDANSVNQLCNRAVLIHEGRVVRDGSPKDITKFYEKLLFSKTSNPNQEKVISELVKPSMYIDSSSDDYIEGLESKSMLKYGDDSTEILDVRIENRFDNRVNVLESGEKYFYKYSIKFDRAISNVAFGLKIKNERGVELTGAATNLNEKYYDVEKGTLLEVSWEFNCNLLAGNYYMNAGASTHFGGEVEFIARKVDAMVFKVRPSSDIVDKGEVYMGLNSKVIIL